MSYSDDLKDPRWQRVKSEAQIRANFTCQACGAYKHQLHVHHRYYVDGRKPWEYPESAFKCLCNKCHGLHHITDGFVHWEQVMTEIEKRGADPITLLFLLDSSDWKAKAA